MGERRIINDRFELHESVGEGGMGIVYRATDHQAQKTVAIKTLIPTDDQNTSRFIREATILADLEHPNVVGYVDHGVSDKGQRFLAMEWLDGCDLKDYLTENGPLGIQDAVHMTEQVALALSEAHNRGVIHRDIKPSNIFLVNKDPNQVRVLDFGIARLARPSQWLTRPGMVVGSPGYMAPEQARGDVDLTARSDIFSLGCVAYHALVGQAPFAAEVETAVLAKILFSDAPHARDSRIDVPPHLDTLIAKMLIKDPNNRPATGGELAVLLSNIDLSKKDPVTVAGKPSHHLTHGERRVVSIVLAGARPGQPSAYETATGASSFDLPTMNARVEILANGCLVACLSDTGVPTDQAIRAARYAQILQERMPNVPIVLATGHGELNEGLPTGEIIDKAVALLADADPGMVRMGKDTASLVRGRFSVSTNGPHWTLGYELVGVNPRHSVLGQQTACLGRNRELDWLRSTFQSVQQDRSAEAVLLTAPAGAGKTRIIQEFLLSEKANKNPVQMLFGQGNSLSEGGTFSLLSGALFHAAGIRKGEPLDQQRLLFKMRMKRHLSESKDTSIIAFLGELAGLSSTDPDDIELRQARHDPRLMGDQLLRAWTEWLSAECKAQTTILVLDDIHWGDAASLAAVLQAVNELSSSPLMVVCGARPEGKDLFPKFWSSPVVTHLRLGKLSRTASTQLVRSVLADQLTDAQVETIVVRADGNAFFLEELIRAAGEGATPDTLPKNVLGMLQARLDALSAKERRVMRAASVFGDVFWLGGVLKLLGEKPAASDLVRGWLANLKDRELLVERRSSTYSDETEYAFRHDLVRVATYTMLTDGDKTLGHRLAANWLETMGQCDPETLARHFELGGVSDHAIRCYLMAAEHALAGNDLQDAMSCAEAGIRCGASGETLGRFQLIRTEALLADSDIDNARESITEALSHMNKGSLSWVRAVGVQGYITLYNTGGPDEPLPHIDALIQVLKDQPDLRVDGINSLARIFRSKGIVSQPDLSGRLVEVMTSLCPDNTEDEPLLGANMAEMQYRQWIRQGRYALALPHLEEAARLYRKAGDMWNSPATELNLGHNLIQVGRFEDAINRFTALIGQTTWQKLSILTGLAKSNQGMALAMNGNPQAGVDLQREALQEIQNSGDIRYVLPAQGYLAHCLWMTGQWEEAKQLALSICDNPDTPLFFRMKVCAYAVLANIGLAQESLDEALEAANQGMKRLEAGRIMNLTHWYLRLAHAEVLIARGNVEEAKATLGATHKLLCDWIADIPDPNDRKQFLFNIPAIVELRALFDQWLDMDDSVVYPLPGPEE